MMSVTSTLLLAFAMSADAFAAALALGGGLRRPPFREALRTGAIFGGIEAITPVIGWAVGMIASSWIADVDHWVAFGLLGILGLKMLWEAFRGKGGDTEAAPQRRSLGTLIVTGISTSLDAMAVGVTLALIDANIWIAAFAIGIVSFAMSTIGVLVGRAVGAYLGRGAEACGGVLMILIGTHILLDHLGLL